jgi:hypothetical protein
MIGKEQPFGLSFAIISSNVMRGSTLLAIAANLGPNVDGAIVPSLSIFAPPREIDA